MDSQKFKGVVKPFTDFQVRERVHLTQVSADWSN